MSTPKLQSRWFEVMGLRLHVRVAPGPSAEAPAVVLVHGAGVSSRYMLPLAGRLAADFRIYIPDLPGFGRSDKPDEIWTTPQHADLLAAWSEAAGLGPSAYLGNSYGCQVVADFAMRYPERVERLVLQGPTADPARRSLPQMFFPWLLNGLREPPSQGLILILDYLDCGMRRLIGTFRESMRDRIEDKLPHIQAPTLVVYGTRDPLLSPAWVGEVARLLPRGELRVVPGGAHTLNYGEELELARIVRPFLLGQENAANLLESRL